MLWFTLASRLTFFLQLPAAIVPIFQRRQREVSESNQTLPVSQTHRGGFDWQPPSACNSPASSRLSRLCLWTPRFLRRPKLGRMAGSFEVVFQGCTNLSAESEILFNHRIPSFIRFLLERIFYTRVILKKAPRGHFGKLQKLDLFKEHVGTRLKGKRNVVCKGK